MSYALKPRKFYLPPPTVQRLGGPRAAEIMQLLIDDKLSQAEIQARLGMEEIEYTSFTKTHAFKRELSAQLRLREMDEKFRKQSRAAKKSIKQSASVEATPSAPSAPALPVASLKRGESPVDWVLRRINEVTPQAVERLVWLMQNARQENVQYNAATKLLGLNGIVEVEKSISVIADAEAIIRELNKRHSEKLPAGDREAVLEAELIPELNATPKEELAESSSGDSDADPTPPSL